MRSSPRSQVLSVECHLSHNCLKKGHNSKEKMKCFNCNKDLQIVQAEGKITEVNATFHISCHRLVCDSCPKEHACSSGPHPWNPGKFHPLVIKSLLPNSSPPPHISSSGNEHLFQCQYCCLWLNPGELNDHHQTSCERNFVRCSYCQQTAPFFHINLHRSNINLCGASNQVKQILYHPVLVELITKPYYKVQQENQSLRSDVELLKKRVKLLENPLSLISSVTAKQPALDVEMKTITADEKEVETSIIVEENNNYSTEWTGGLTVIKDRTGKRKMHYVDGLSSEFTVGDLKRRVFRVFYQLRSIADESLGQVVLKHNNTRLLEDNNKCLWQYGIKNTDEIDYTLLNPDQVVLKPSRKRNKKEIFHVKTIIGHRLIEKDKYEYRVEWDNYESEHNTWEPKESFNPKLISDYWKNTPINLEKHPV